MNHEVEQAVNAVAEATKAHMNASAEYDAAEAVYEAAAEKRQKAYSALEDAKRSLNQQIEWSVQL